MAVSESTALKVTVPSPSARIAFGTIARGLAEAVMVNISLAGLEVLLLYFPYILGSPGCYSAYFIALYHLGDGGSSLFWARAWFGTVQKVFLDTEASLWYKKTPFRRRIL